MTITETLALVPWNGWLMTAAVFLMPVMMVLAALKGATPPFRTIYKLMALILAATGLSLFSLHLVANPDVFIALAMLVLALEALLAVVTHRRDHGAVR